jgi:signal peptidase II
LQSIHKIALAVLVLVCCTGFDQFTKGIARERFAASPPLSLLNDTLRIQYLENSGITLGMGSNLPPEVRFLLFVLLSGLISATTLLVALRARDLRPWQFLGLVLVASGGTGNLLDRIFNHGAVRDFMNLGIGSIRTGVFNVADVLIVTGAALFLVFSLKAERKSVATYTC